MDRNRDYWIIFTRDASYRVSPAVALHLRVELLEGTATDNSVRLFQDIFGADCIVRVSDISSMTHSDDAAVKAEWRHDILMTKERDAMIEEINKETDEPEWLRG
jgi:hypothetical protein